MVAVVVVVVAVAVVVVVVVIVDVVVLVLVVVVVVVGGGGPIAARAVAANYKTESDRCSKNLVALQHELPSDDASKG